MVYEDEQFPTEIIDKEQAFEQLKKAFEIGKINSDTFFSAYQVLEKAKSNLVAKKVFAKKKDGKIYMTTVWVNPNSGEKIEKPGAKYVEVPIETPELMMGESVKITKTDGKVLEGICSYMKAWKDPDGSPNASIVVETFDGSTKQTNVGKIKKFEKFSNEEPKGELDKFGYKIIKTLGGSTGAQLVEKNGQKFVKKTAANPEHLANEVRSIKYFSQMGVRVPNVEQYEKGEAVYLEFIDGQELGKIPSDQLAQATKMKLFNSFAAHAIMSNWDMVGMNLDNVMIDGNGNPVFIDVGGSMGYRAQGGIKEEWVNWNNNDPISEFKTMFDSKMNSQTAALLKDCFAQFLEGKDLSILEELEDFQSELINNQLKYIKELNPNWYVSPTSHSEKLKQRLDSALKQTSKGSVEPVQTTENAANLSGDSLKDFYMKRFNEKMNDSKNSQAYQDLRSSYADQIKFADDHYRYDIKEFFEDFCKMMFIDTEEKSKMEKDMESYTANASTKKYMKESGLSLSHISAIKTHTGASSYMNNIFRNLVKGIKDNEGGDNYNISFKNKESKISFNFDAYKQFEILYTEKTPDNDFLKAKSILHAFQISEKEGNNQHYKTDVTAYRGVGTNEKTQETLGSEGGNILCDVGVSSNGVVYEKSFNQNTKVIFTGAKGIFIDPISTHKGEKEIILKPFNIQQTTLFRDTSADPKSDHSFTGRYQVRVEKPGLIPIKFAN